MLNPLVIMLGLGDGFHAIGHAIMLPLYWAVSGLVVLFHAMWSPVFGSDSGATWTLAIITLTIFIRILLIPLFVKQINSARAMQLIQPKMKYLFPLMYLFSGVSFPIGVMIYWATSNLWTLGQQEILIRNNPTPNTPAYIDWQERMRAKGKDPDEIERQRREKRRRKVVSATPTPAGDPSDAARPAVARQQVTRQTFRKDANGNKQVVRRQQPARQSRSKRKH